MKGAASGLTYLFHPDWSKLVDYNAWVGKFRDLCNGVFDEILNVSEALTEVVFNQCLGSMALITLGSLNKRQNNFIKDVAVVFSINTAIHLFSAIFVFSTLGFLADVQGVTLNDVVGMGLNLAFVTIPQAVVYMGIPPLWSALFFLMIILLGLGQQLVFLESISLAIVDNWPALFGRDRLKLNIALCLALALLGFTMCTRVSLL